MVFAGLNALGGLQAVVIFAILMLSVTFTALYLLVRRKSNPVVAILITMVAAAASSIHWLARPHLFTLLFLVLFYAALEQVREGRTRFAGVPILAALPVMRDLLGRFPWRLLRRRADGGAYGGGDIAPGILAEYRDRARTWRGGAQLFY